MEDIAERQLLLDELKKSLEFLKKLLQADEWLQFLTCIEKILDNK